MRGVPPNDHRPSASRTFDTPSLCPKQIVVGGKRAVVATSIGVRSRVRSVIPERREKARGSVGQEVAVAADLDRTQSSKPRPDDTCPSCMI